MVIFTSSHNPYEMEVHYNNLNLDLPVSKSLMHGTAGGWLLPNCIKIIALKTEIRETL